MTSKSINRIRRVLCAFLGLSAAATASSAAQPAYDFYICANINRNYVIGSRIETVNGLYQLNEAGEWQHFGVNDTTLSAFAFSPDDRDVIFTSALNGIWVSWDGGESWRQTNSWDMTEGRDVAVDPHAPEMVYLALPSGIAVSTDRGHTWERRENGLPERGKYTQTIEVDRTTKGRVLAGCEKGVFLSEDAGAVWRRVLPTATTVNDLEQSPHDPQHWLAVTDTHGAWSSRDGGETWTAVDGLPIKSAIYNVTFDPTHAERLAIASWTDGIWTSEDGGATWTNRDAGLPENPRVYRVGVDPNRGRLYASVFQETLFYSDDFGRTWQADPLAGSLVLSFVSVPRAQP
ncbi:WD40/YVTN/BNR-like repeat-containing protein [Actomonas aquatica]|uniref:Sortilin N-terminal domain-containing protein n=1 Tax=Actomonas aquatica TaxID=2866162 RepID=A0ABZ1CD26_9BACT|nr:hypothetical protein [Opitutus sp. WL0086]WRQ89579.1 hypothetical protein K1X11_009175 [Opitutus sp. WL0086]